MITYIIGGFLGWIAGILVNYLADVLPLRRRLTRPFCIQCDAKVPWLNYLLWPRRCPACGYHRNIRVWVVEIIYIVTSLLIQKYPPAHLGYVLGLIILTYFGVVVLIDLEYRLIMHPVSIFGAVLGLLVGVLRVGWIYTLIGGLTGFGVMWLLYLLGALIMKFIARRRGQILDDVALGFGDVNLSGVIGLMLGWPLILVGLVIAVLIGGVVSLVYILIMLISRKYHAFMALPYGPFLVSGAILLIYFRDVILQFLGG